MKSMKNIKKPVYAKMLGKGVFAAVPASAWYCKYCMKSGSSVSGIISGSDFRPTDTGPCSKSPTGHHVWEHD